tara:strand:- start:1197 stop:2336 length:1140 start_codon:yes stop_codon:yes gene_type:complete
MANSDLIKGAGALAKSEGFVNYAEAINVPNPTKGANSYIEEDKRKQATQARVNKYIDNLKSNIDLDGLSPEQTSAMRGFLVSQRGIYANAASEIAKIEDATSPEYQQYADIMNEVNRSFVTLSEEVKSYKDAKTGYVETHQADLYSNAASGSEIQTAASLYGLDPEMPAAFSVGNGGHIMFEVNGESQSYKDYKEPMLKDYKTMNSLLSTTNSIYSAGQRLDGTKLQLIGAQVENMLANPNTIKSILAGDFKGAGIDLSGIAYNPEDVAGTRVQVKDAIVSALESVANEGYAEKERKRAERNNSNSKVADPSKTDKIYSQIDTEAKNGTYNLIPVTQNQQLVWSPEQNAYISMVRSSQSSPWKAETNADGNTVGYAPKS